MKIQKQIKHLCIVCFVLVISLFLSACIGSDLESFYITRAENIKLNVGETYTFDNYYISSNEEIFAMDGNVGTALKTGKVHMTKPDSDMVEYVISIEYMPKYIDVSCDNILKPGDTSELEIVISPIRVSQEVIYEISDESVIRIEGNTIIAVNEGYADVKIKSKVKEDVYTSIGFIVQNSDEIDYEDKIEFEYEENSQINIDSTNIGAQINALMKSVENTFVGIEQYTKSTMSDFGGGVLYKRNAVLADDSVIEDVDFHDLDENIKGTKEVVDMCNLVNVQVEGELGHIGKAVDGVSNQFTEVKDAVKFVKETGVKALAIQVGTAHGRYKQAPVLAIDRIRVIKEATGVHLVLHGGSGVPDDQIKAAVKAGIRKMNFSTDLCYTFIESVQEQDKNKIAIDLIMKEPIDKVKEFCLSKIDVLGSRNRV